MKSATHHLVRPADALICCSSRTAAAGTCSVHRQLHRISRLFAVRVFDAHPSAARPWQWVGVISGLWLACCLMAVSSGQTAARVPADAAAEPTTAPDFVRDVRPLLSGACFHCHGPDEETREAELRLDRPDGLFADRDGRQIVVPGDAAGSELVRRILSTDPDTQMPPPGSKKPLTDAQKQTLVDWVRAGASWSPHWAFVPPEKPPVPQAEQTVRALPQQLRTSVTDPNATAAPPGGGHMTDIDQFILARLQDTGLRMSPPADPWTLVRRLFLDLIGLPPTPEEADAWVTRIWGLPPAPSAGALQSVPVANEAEYSALVDSLLARPEYGERWARHWLDLARYADSNGYEKDRPRSMWPYRDWVVDAINADMPFDQFTIEQLAGDLLPAATTSQRIATGFHRNTMINEEGGIDPLEFRFHAMTDRVATTGTTWLGLTLGCAQCHTHKYDPITHREYYQLLALLNNADEPVLELPGPDYATDWAGNRERAVQLLQELPSQWPVDALDFAASRITAAASSAAETLTVGEEQLVTASGPAVESATWTLDLLVDSAEVNSLQLQAVSPPGRRGPGRTAHGNFVLSEVQVAIVLPATESGEREVPVPLLQATASVEQSGFPVTQAIDGRPETGWAVDSGQGVPDSAIATFQFKGSLSDLLAEAQGAAATVSPPSVPVQLRVRLQQTYGRQHVLSALRLRAGRQLPAAELQQRRAAAVEQAFVDWLAAERRTAVAWSDLQPVAAVGSLPHLTIEPDRAIFASGDTAKQDVYEIELAPSASPITALRLEALPDDRLPGHGPGTTWYEGTPGDFYLTELVLTADDQPVPLRTATESYARNQFGNSPVAAQLTLDGDIQTGWSVFGGQGERHTAVYIPVEPIPAGRRLKVRMNFGRHFASSLGRFRFAAAETAFEPGAEPVARRMPDAVERLLLKPADECSAAERQQLFEQFLLNAPHFRKQAEQIRRLQLPPATTTTLVLSERPPENPRPTFRHHRGEYLQPREQVEPGVPAFLHAWPVGAPVNRLGLARWLVDRRNPLTARVTVNRHWAALFGTGLVATVDDFGLQGAAPSHPQLLDWLAVTLMEDDQWSIKRLHRRLVTSSVYRQQAVVSREALQVDPENRLLSWAPRFRLEAEIIRDAVLQASGVLSPRRGGPPVRPPQPAGITEVAFGSPAWVVSEGADRYRRSLYTFIKRTAPFAMVTTFDGPSGESCIARRNRSNSPLQALTLLNDVMFVDLAQAAARRLVDEARQNMPDDATVARSTTDHLPAVDDPPADQDRQLVTRLFRRLLTRFPEAEELEALTEFVRQQRRRFREHPDEARAVSGVNDLPEERAADSAGGNAAGHASAAARVAEVAAWTTVARALAALDEAQTRP